MTRLKNDDISHIPPGLRACDAQLLSLTGKSLKAIAGDAAGLTGQGVSEQDMDDRIKNFPIHVIPVTAGLGIITGFSQTVCDILKFIGFPARVAGRPDVCGLAESYENKSRGIMMADDHRFVGINLETRTVSDNSEATGRIFARALIHGAGGSLDMPVLVMGCGPVGESAARTLLRAGARVDLYDIHPRVASALKDRLYQEIRHKGAAGGPVQVVNGLGARLKQRPYIIEATPSSDTISPEGISSKTLVSAPGVPLGIGRKALDRIGDRLIHDKLALGVAAMAMDLIKANV